MNRITRISTLQRLPSSLPLPLRSSYSTTPTPPSRPTPVPKPTNLPGSNLPPPTSANKYSPTTVKLVTSVAKLFGYHGKTSTAIRVTSDYYDRCAERGQVEAPFFYEECALPPSFQTWFSLTTLHIWLLSVRFRSLPPPLGRTYIQELINHFFIDIELRIRGPYGVTQGRLIKGYMKDVLEQYHGSIAAYDEALIKGDEALTAAVWRNAFGAGWGGNVGGVKGKKAPKSGFVPLLGPNPNPEGLMHVDPIQKALLKKGKKEGDIFTTDDPVKNPELGEFKPLYPEYPDLQFLVSLEKIVVWIRKELVRLERLPEESVTMGKPEMGRKGLVDFGKI